MSFSVRNLPVGGPDWEIGCIAQCILRAGWFSILFAADLKQVLSYAILVLMARPALWELVGSQGAARLNVAVGRPLLRDPYWASNDVLTDASLVTTNVRFVCGWGLR